VFNEHFGSAAGKIAEPDRVGWGLGCDGSVGLCFLVIHDWCYGLERSRGEEYDDVAGSSGHTKNQPIGLLSRSAAAILMRLSLNFNAKAT